MKSGGKEKFIFPNKGIWAVANKVAEADFFLEKMKSAPALSGEFEFYFSAFASASRSITFSLQYVMSSYPEFEAWYEGQRELLKEDFLARFFVKTRNDNQKKGFTEIYRGGYVCEEGLVEVNSFSGRPFENKNNVPEGDIVNLSEDYLVSLLEVVGRCYRHFDTYIDPRSLFTKQGLDELGWSINDLEEYLGFPMGYTDISGDWDDKEGERLALLSRYGFDEQLDAYLNKYQISVPPSRFK